MLRFHCGGPEQLECVSKMMSWKHTLLEDQTHYVPPRSQERVTQGAVLVSEGVVVVQDPVESEIASQTDVISLESSQTIQGKNGGESQMTK